MGVVEAKIQTVEDIYRLIWTAASHKQPVRAMYKDLPRLFCPHRLGRNRAGGLRVLCYQYGGGRGRGAGPTCLAATARRGVLDRLRGVGVLDGSLVGAPNPAPAGGAVGEAAIDTW